MDRPETSRRPISDARFRGALVAIAFVAFAARAIHLVSVLRSPLGVTLVEDAAYYHEAALRLSGALPGSAVAGPSFMNLGLPYVLAAIYRISGPGVTHALAVQAIAGSLAALFVALAAATMTGDRRVGIAAGAVTALSATGIFYDGLLLTPSLVNAALAAVMLLLANGRSRARLGLAGIVAGLAVLLRANVLLTVPFLALAVALGELQEHAATRMSAAMRATTFLAASLALPLAIASWNGLAHREWAPVSSNGGMNFWVGNSIGATGVYTPAPFLREVNPAAEERAFLDEARRRTGNPSLTIAGSSGFWLREGLSDVARAPGRWLSLEGRKLALFWNAFEINTNVGFAFVAKFSPVLRFLPTGFGWLALPGVAGLALLAKRRPAEAAVPLSLVAGSLATVLLFFASGEYRHPASLAFTVGTGVVVIALADAVRWKTTIGRGETRAGALAVLLVAPMVFWVFAPLRSGCNPRYDFANLAREIATERPGSPPPNLADFTRASALLDRAPDAQRDAVILDARTAIETAAAAQRNDADWAREALDDLASLASLDLTPGQGTYSDSFLRRASSDLRARARMLAAMEPVRRDAALAQKAELLGADGWHRVETLLRAGDVQGAKAFVEAARRISPHDVDLMAEHGRVLLHLGDDRGGLALLESSCNGWPETPRCAIYAAIWYATHGHPSEARGLAQEALRRDPTSNEARVILARLPG